MSEMPKILLVDDDAGLVDVLSMALEDAGFRVAAASDGRAGLELFAGESPDLVILDLLMPELDGLELTRRIRAQSGVPIIMLTSRDEEMDKVLGLEMGADDYVTKPFSTRELIARIRAALRRGQGARNGDDCERCVGLLRMDRNRRRTLVGEQPIELTATEFELLWTLLGAPGVVHSRDALINAIYGVDIIVTDRTIDTFVKRLRRKIGEAGGDWDALETVRGVGYRLREA